MSDTAAVLLTDVVDSTKTHVRWGDPVMAQLWASHDHAARELIRMWRGREIGRSDGFLVLFATARDAVGFALAYHSALAALVPPLQARVGVHVGDVILRENSAADAAQGATPFEVDGLAVPVAARLMSAALGRQTLLSSSALLGLGPTHLLTHSHGHWRFKGLGEPMEVFEVGEPDAPFVPPPDSAKAYRVVRTGERWLPVRDVPHNLPADRDTFIGRRDLLVTLARRFDDGARMVTLVGMGGIGKTRLALQHAHSWLGDYSGGAWFSDLSAARSSNGIAHALAKALDVRLGKADPIKQLAAAIAGRGACLMILDNFEQVSQHAEETLGAWMEHAPQARFIVTSREVLGIVGEHVLMVKPLDSGEAIQMFQERVRSAGIQNQLTAEDEGAIASLVELLDCLPLAIELAAARLRVMPPRVLLKRMGERFKLLAKRGGRRDRQATLLATLDWSWDLLSRTEQSTLVQLAVFEGGFTLEAAEAVVNLSDSQTQMVADAVQDLIEKSLISAMEESRLGFVRTVLDYLLDRISTRDLSGSMKNTYEEALKRHWLYFGRMSEQTAVSDRCADLDNLVVACRRSVSKSSEFAVRTLENIWAALRLVGPFSAISPLIAMVEAAGPHPPAQQSSIHWVAAGALHQNGDPKAALAQAEAGLEIVIRCKDVHGQARMHLTLAEILRTLGRSAASSQHGTLALAAAESGDDWLAQVKALNSLGASHHGDSQFELARSYYERALKIAERLEAKRWMGGLLGNLASIEYAQGRWDEAARLYEQALKLAKHVGDRQWEGNHRSNFGMLCHEMGDAKAALTALDEALQIARTIGHGRLERIVLCNTGIVLEAGNQMPQAQECYEASIELCVLQGDSRSEGQYRGYLGLLLARMSQDKPSTHQMDRAVAILLGLGDPNALALLTSQRALAAALRGNKLAASRLLSEAETLIAQLSIETTPDWQRLLIEVRGKTGSEHSSNVIDLN